MNTATKDLRFFLCIAVVAAILAGCAGRMPVPGTESEGDLFYMMARHLMTGQESRVYKSLTTAEARQRFISYFWEIRDPNPMTEENEFRAEIQDRFEYIQRHFQEGQRPGWRTDRGWIYSILGPPEEVDMNARIDDSSRNKGRAILWYYGFTGSTGLRIPGGGFRLLFWDQKGFGEYRLHQNSMPLRVLDIMEQLKYNMIVNNDPDSQLPEALEFSVKYDGDSSRVWISFGPKNVSVERVSGKALARFHVDVLVFDGKEKMNKFSRDWDASIEEGKLLDKDFRFRIPLDVAISPGKRSLDVVVTDMVSGRKSRRQVNVRISGKSGVED